MRDDRHSKLPRFRGLYLWRPAEGSPWKLYQEVTMQGAVEELSITEVEIHKKPAICSHDSGSECSLEHWLEVYWLVEEEYTLAKIADAEHVD